MGSEVVELFVPVVMFIVVGMVPISFFYFRYKTRVQAHKTIDLALEKGAELTPDLIDRMVSPPKSAEDDLRRGIVALSIGLSFALFGLILDEAEAVRPLVAISMFPFLIGLAYLLMWKFTNRGVKTED